MSLPAPAQGAVWLPGHTDQDGERRRAGPVGR